MATLNWGEGLLSEDMTPKVRLASVKSLLLQMYSRVMRKKSERKCSSDKIQGPRYAMTTSGTPYMFFYPMSMHHKTP